MEFSQTISFSGKIISWTPLSAGILIVGMAIILFGQRKYVLPTFLTLSILMSLALHVVIFGFNLMPHRVFVICAWIRFLAKGEHRGLTLKAMDKAFIALCCWLIVTETVQTGIPGFVYAFANSAIDALGSYFLCRLLIREREDLQRVIGALAVLCAVVAVFMGIEYVTGRNWLTSLGAVQDLMVSRKGRPRCAASFSIAITAGTFGAVLLPLFVACRWQQDGLRKWAIPGCIASTIITIAAGSASPLSTYIMAIFGLLAWRVHQHMRKIRWGILLSLIGLHMVMKAPVWALIMRIQIVPGSSAYHRFNILDTFIRNIGEWWLYGMPSTAKWGWEMDDVANQYCVIAKHGGLLALFLFIRVIALGFREVGTGIKEAERDWPTRIMIWAIGVMLFAHATAFFGISYFDQMKLAWYVSLAMVCSVGVLTEKRAEAEVRNEEVLQGEIPDGIPTPAR